MAKSLVWSSVAILVWKTICSSRSFCFPLTHFHLLSSFSHLILLCLHTKNKRLSTNLGSATLPKNKKALWSHTFPTLSAYSTHSDVKGDQELLVVSSELNPFLLHISHAQSTEPLPKVSIDLVTTALHNWHSISFSKLPSTSQTIPLSPPAYISVSIFVVSSLPSVHEEMEKPYQLSSYMTLHPFSDNFSNILKHLYVVNFQVSQLHIFPN